MSDVERTGRSVQTNRLTINKNVYTSYQLVNSSYSRDIKPDRDRTPRPALRWTPPKPYYRDVREFAAPYRWVKATSQGYPYEQEGPVECLEFFGKRNVFAATPAISLETRATLEALSDLKDQKVDLATNIATANQTAQMVADVANLIAKARRAWRRKDLRLAADLLRVSFKGQRKLPQDWLAYQYGVKPFLSDVHGAMEALYESANKNPDNWMVSGKGRAGDSLYKEEYLYGEPGSMDSLRGISSGRQSVFVRIDAGPTNALLAAAASLGLTNPAQVAWELVPFSFVIDWFLPIGDYFSTLDATFGLQCYGGSTSRRVEWRTEIIGGPPPPETQDNVGWVGAYKPGFARRIYLQRSVFHEFPTAVPLYWKNPFSFGHLANSLSLLASAL